MAKMGLGGGARDSPSKRVCTGLEEPHCERRDTTENITFQHYVTT